MPEYKFRKCVGHYNGNKHAVKSNCGDQFFVMSFVGCAYWRALRDIETTLDLAAVAVRTFYITSEILYVRKYE